MTDNGMFSRWWRNAAVYQIYPWSFKDSNGDGRGDLRGIIDNLDYLNGKPSSLGVDAIWLSPIFRSPMVDLGYDVSDYCDIDPVFGTLEDFDALILEAHKRNIKVLLDYVPNHTSDQHPWFVESRSSSTSAKRDWYVWRDGKPDGTPPNNWLSRFGGSAWTLDKTTRQYYLHTFFEQQPDLNWQNTEVQEAMLSVLRFWMDRGVDGFRVDAITHLSKDNEFHDDPLNPDYVPGKLEPYFSRVAINSANFEGRIRPLELMARTVEQYDGRVLVTEAYDDIEKLRRYRELSPKGLVVPFNFHFIHIENRPKLPWNARRYREFVDSYEASLRPVDAPNYVLGNHDKPRIATRVGLEKARLLAVLQLTLRGAAFIYYGEELGMEDTPIPKEMQRDPFCQLVPDLGVCRDPERTPMQWSGGPNAGFSNGGSWLPPNPDYTSRNIETELADPSSMLNLYRTLLGLRRSSPALREGSYRSVAATSPDVLHFLREHPQETIAVLLNFAEEERKVYLNGSAGRFLCSTHSTGVSPGQEMTELVLRPFEARILSMTPVAVGIPTVSASGQESQISEDPAVL